MKENDFDFEALDEVVNSALTGSASSAPAPEAPKATPVPTAPPRVINRSMADDDSGPGHSVSPASRRSAGRFMDMVHPSSDMKQQGMGAPAVSPSFTKPAPIVPKPVPPAPRPQAPIARPVAPVVIPPKEEEKPLESPFLPDAVVEKRPLGSPATAQRSAVPDFLSGPKEELLEFPEEPRIEPKIEEPVREVEPKVEEKTPEVLQDYSSATEVTDLPRHDGPRPKTGALYDTESYHQPAPVARKKSGPWMIIMWLVLLALLGAAAGVAVYMFVLPLL